MFDTQVRQVTEYVGEFNTGDSRPLLVTIEGIGPAILKYNGNPQGNRVLANEVIGHQLCDLMGLEHPKCGIADLPIDLLGPTGSLELPETDRYDSCVVSPGKHFYIELLEPALYVDAEELASLQVVNGGMFPGVVTLDLLVGNKDRSSRNPNLLVHRSEGHQRLTTIDLGSSFGGGVWGLGNLLDPSFAPVSEPVYGPDFAPFMEAIRNPTEAFRPWVDIASRLTDAQLTATVAAIPNEWELTDEERTELVNYMLVRRNGLSQHVSRRIEEGTW